MTSSFTFAKGANAVTEASYPYTAQEGSCKSSGSQTAILQGDVIGFKSASGLFGAKAADVMVAITPNPVHLFVFKFFIAIPKTPAYSYDGLVCGGLRCPARDDEIELGGPGFGGPGFERALGLYSNPNSTSPSKHLRSSFRRAEGDSWASQINIITNDIIASFQNSSLGNASSNITAPLATASKSRRCGRRSRNLASVPEI